MNRAAQLRELDELETDHRLQELRERVNRPGNFHVPEPGDADYQTPEQIARIKADRRRNPR